MTTPTTRGAAITAFCRQCIYDRHAHGTWREQTGACTSITCPLWKFRPLPATAPAWLRARDPKRLPDGFITPDTDHVLTLIRGQAADGHGCPEKCHSVELETPRAPDPMPTYCPDPAPAGMGGFP